MIPPILSPQLEPVRTGHDLADNHDKNDQQNYPAATARARAPPKSECALEKIIYPIEYCQLEQSRQATRLSIHVILHTCEKVESIHPFRRKTRKHGIEQEKPIQPHVFGFYGNYGLIWANLLPRSTHNYRHFPEDKGWVNCYKKEIFGTHFKYLYAGVGAKFQENLRVTMA
jgi:hypothetical protein